MTSTHEPGRPSWRCLACGADWPCPTRRAELVADSGGSRVALALRMARYFSEAVDDRPDVSVEVLYDRLLAWVRAPRT